MINRLVATILIAITGAASAASPAVPIDVSVINLISTPEKYEGKFINVVGYLHLEYEGDGLYLHEEDMRHTLSKNSLCLSFNDEVAASAKKYNNHYVIIEGFFTASSKGQLGMCSGTIEHVSRVEVNPQVG
jgi:hypothetical protein